MSIQTFEYCSLQYLNLWLSYDRFYYQALSSPSQDEQKLSALKGAAAFYKVARNLPKKYDVQKGLKRYQPVLKIIDSVDQKQFQNPVEKINEISQKISHEYGNRNVLSLTTKFLWLKVKHPILIYDSQARTALGAKNGDLADFYQKWQQEFKNHQEQIKVACAKLEKLSLYTVEPETATEKDIQNISSELWFHERVFDNYLWNKGNN